VRVDDIDGLPPKEVESTATTSLARSLVLFVDFVRLIDRLVISIVDRFVFAIIFNGNVVVRISCRFFDVINSVVFLLAGSEQAGDGWGA
jgi:hypothetical protein